MDCCFLFSMRHHKLYTSVHGENILQSKRQIVKLRDDNCCMQQIGYVSENREEKKNIRILCILAVQ